MDHADTPDACHADTPALSAATGPGQRGIEALLAGDLARKALVLVGAGRLCGGDDGGDAAELWLDMAGLPLRFKPSFALAPSPGLHAEAERPRLLAVVSRVRPPHHMSRDSRALTNHVRVRADGRSAAEQRGTCPKARSSQHASLSSDL